jgi:hypothetical protein
MRWSTGSVDVELRLTRVKRDVLEMLRRDGVIKALGESQVYGNVYEAAADKISDTPANGL